MEITTAGLKAREAGVSNRLQELAYERLQLTRRVEEIDRELDQLEGAQAANSLTRKDLGTDAAIAAAKSQTESSEKENVK